MIESRFILRVTMTVDKTGFLWRLRKDRKIVLKFTQANIIETVEFLEVLNSKDFSLIEYLFDFLNTYGDKKIDKKLFEKYYIHNLSKVLDTLRNTRFRGVFGDIGQVSEEKEEEDTIDPDDIPNITEEFREGLAKSIAFLTSRMGIDPKTLQKNYNFEEFRYWENYYYYIERSKTEEGQKENKRLDTAKRMEREKHLYDRAFQKLENYLNSKQK